MCRCRGDEEFGLGSVDILLKEFLEFTLAVVEVIGSKAPEVHRHRGVGPECLLNAVLVGKHDIVVLVVGEMAVRSTTEVSRPSFVSHTPRATEPFSVIVLPTRKPTMQ